jgi:BlaI family transcriptional regulator, penicillinase repressor
MSDPAVEPNDTELEILKRFWRDGELSAREVHERITPELDWTPSTTRTVLERMRAKRLLSRRHVHGVVVYAHLQPKVQVLGRLMRRLSDLLELNGALPAAAFSGSQILGPEEIAELEAVLAGEAKDDAE